jgi:S1-C subfamily serine protease
LALTLQSSESSPVVNPAIVIKNWGDAAAQLKLNGKPVNWGKDFRREYVKHLDGDDLVVWIRQTSTAPVQIALTPER